MTGAIDELEAERGRWRLELSMGDDVKISRLKVTPASPDVSEPPVVRNEIRLELPFRGQWLVGRLHGTPDKTSPSDQRRAADLVVVDVNDKAYRGDGKRNEDYYAWGKEILAVADGNVVTVVDGVPENELPQKNVYFVPGNLVIVEHGPKLFSAYAHLQPGSIRVRVGHKLRRGQVLGLCGNSGNSSEPHLHFQLQDGPRPEHSWGIEPVFSDVVVVRDGKKSVEQQYSFRKGDRVEAAARAR